MGDGRLGKEKEGRGACGQDISYERRIQGGKDTESTSLVMILF